MHTIRAGRASDIRSIVDEQSRVAATSDLNRASCKFKKHARSQSFLAYLKERDFCGYRSFELTEGCLRIVDRQELFERSSCRSLSR